MEKRFSIALGTFDGVHIGHRAVLAAAAEVEHAVPLAVTFREPPSAEKAAEKLISLESKLELLRNIGFEAEVLDFESVRELSAEEFSDRLFSKYKVASIACGFNYRFGKNASGDTALLEEYCRKRGVGFAACPPVLYRGEAVSSTRIREALSDGRMSEVSAMLGYDWFVSAEVLHGDARGRTIGFPTVNQLPEDRTATPRHGVYRSSVLLDGKEYPAVTNFGIRPSFKQERPSYETHIIGFSGELYGKTLRVSLKEYLREEKRFSSLEELKRALEEDIRACK